jgi:hypothetical protein
MSLSLFACALIDIQRIERSIFGYDLEGVPSSLHSPFFLFEPSAKEASSDFYEICVGGNVALKLGSMFSL